MFCRGVAAYNTFKWKCNFITSIATSLGMPVIHLWSFSHSLFLFTIITVSPFLSHSPSPSPSPLSLSLSLSLSQSVTHSDSLCNMPSSKLNSTLLDLQPFPSSKWLTSVITLQPEWETQQRGREEGWQTETWHERRGNAGLIIHTYCSKKRASDGERDTGRKIEKREIGGERLTQMGRYS